MASPFVVPAARLLREVPSTVAVAFAAPFAPAEEVTSRDETATDVPAGAEVEVAVRLESFQGGLRARGTVRAPWRGQCRRCLAPVSGVIESTVDERFVADGTADDDLAYRFTGDEVDLSDLVRDALVLELPLVPLCRPDCRGLCPQCGVDRNVTSCDCRAPGDPRWATLDALRFDVEAGGSDPA